MGNTLQTPLQQQENPHQQQQQQHNAEDELPGPQTQNFTCEICIEPMLSPNKKFTNKNLCTHPFCVDCMIKYIHVKLDDNVAEIPCPALHCTQSLDAFSCRAILSPQLFIRWCDVLCDAFLLGVDGCYCPYRNCSVLVINECGGDVKKSKCPNCKRLFCFKCKLPWHAGFRCEESRELRDPNDVAFGVLAERNKWMRCPRCRHFVQRIEGCKIIKCRCRTSFCYRCGKQVYQHWCGCDTASMCCLVFLRICTIIVCVFAILAFFLAAIKSSYVYKH